MTGQISLTAEALDPLSHYAHIINFTSAMIFEQFNFDWLCCPMGRYLAL